MTNATTNGGLTYVYGRVSAVNPSKDGSATIYVAGFPFAAEGPLAKLPKKRGRYPKILLVLKEGPEDSGSEVFAVFVSPSDWLWKTVQDLLNRNELSREALVALRPNHIA